MNYTKIYNSLINTRQQLKRTKHQDGLLESHHIHPKSLGGTNNISNLVLLTPREHYVAHWLLYKIHQKKDKAKMAYAFFKMCQRNPTQTRNISSKQYERAKITVSKTCRGENHPNYGKVLWSDEQKKVMSNRMSGSNNHRYGISPWNKGLTKETNETVANIAKNREGKDCGFGKGYHHSDQTKRQMSKAHLGKKLSEETKAKLSKINMGKKLSEETKAKMSKSRQGIPQKEVQCPRCGRIGGFSAMHRWHFDNCKLRVN